MGAPTAARQTAQPQRADPQRSAAHPALTGGVPARLGISRLQRAVGNLGMHRLLRSGGIQPKLTIGRADDEYEREADRVADEVMRMPDSTCPIAPQRSTLGVQRMCSHCEEEELQRAPLRIQRLCAECGDEHDKDVVQAKGRSDSPETSAELTSYVAATRGGGGPLPPSTRARLEPRFGYDFSRVRVHTDGPAAQAARGISAQAFTAGSDVYFAAGRYDPNSASGQRLLSHELTHVIQQGYAPSEVRRQPDTCPPGRHEQADHGGTCPEIHRDRGERRRFTALGPSVRTITPLECYVIENLSIGAADIGILRDLDAIADFMQLNTGATLHLTGFADCLGSAATNANLRTNRASAVEDYFINVLGVDRGRVFVEFAGETEYLDTNATAIGRAGNRAVAVYLNLGSTPSPSPEPQAPPQTQPPPDPATLTDFECAMQVAQGLGTGWLALLPSCPCTRALVDAENVPLPEADRWVESTFGLDCFHPGAVRCFRRDSGTHAQQCCYDGAGNLITAGAAAGTPDFVPSSGTGHQSTDVWTFRQLGWERYGRFWVPNNGNGCTANTVGNASDCRNYHYVFASRPATCAP